MKRGTWVFAGILVVFGLLLLLAAGLGLHSRSIMGMMNARNGGMMSMFGMMWTMRLWGALLILIAFTGLIGLFIFCYRLIEHGSAKCPSCHYAVQANWTFCPKCGADLSSHQE